MTGDGKTVVLFGDYDYDYFREVSLRDGLKSQGARVRECRFSDEPLFIGPKKLLLFPLFCIRIFLQMRHITASEEDIDAIVLTKFNPLFAPIAAWYAWRTDSMFVYDLFVSLYRTGELHGFATWKVRIVYYLEWIALRFPDYLLTETEEFANLYSELYSLPAERIIGIPIGANEEWFHPRDSAEKQSFDRFTVVYWGNFLPHHGMDTILDAAAILRDEPIDFVFCGDGPETERIERVAREKDLDAVSFRGRVPWEDLSKMASSADVALGIFADDPRSKASITNKVSEGVAAGAPVVTMRSPAIEQWFTHGEDIYLVPPANPAELAAAIETLRDDASLRNRIATGGRETYERVFSVEHIGELLVEKLSLSSESD